MPYYGKFEEPLDQVPWFPIQLHSFMQAQRGIQTRSIFLPSQCIVRCISQCNPVSDVNILAKIDNFCSSFLNGSGSPH